MLDKHALTLSDVSFSYKKGTMILNKVSAELLPGTITALIGENGCGKTTLLRILSGITTPSSGNIIFDGNIITAKNLIQYKKNLGFMPEQLTLYPEDKVYKVLQFFSALRKQKISHQKIDEVLKKVGLLEHKNKKVSALSKGLKQRLNFAQAIIYIPKIAIFDEPSNGFDYLGVNLFYKTLKELTEKGTIIILTSHIFSELWGKVDNILIMKNGTIYRKVAAKFGKISHLNGSTHKLLFLQLNQKINDDLFAKILKIAPNTVKLESDTIKSQIQIMDIIKIVSMIKEMDLKVIDFQVDSIDIEMMLREEA